MTAGASYILIIYLEERELWDVIFPVCLHVESFVLGNHRNLVTSGIVGLKKTLVNYINRIKFLLKPE